MSAKKPDHVMVVNDDPVQLAIMAVMLEQDGGYSVETVSCVGDALDNLQGCSRVPDLVITDLYMPGIDGWKFCRVLRAHEREDVRTVPIIVVSATFAGSGAETVTAMSGANAFLSQPVGRDELARCAASLIGRRHVGVERHALFVGDDGELMTLAAPFRERGFTIHEVRGPDGGTGMPEGFEPEVVFVDVRSVGTTRGVADGFRRGPSGLNVVVALVRSGEGPADAELYGMGFDGIVHIPRDRPEDIYSRFEMLRSERSLLRIETLLDLRTHELRESEKRFSALFNNMLNGFALLDAVLDNDGEPAGCIVCEVNGALERMTGVGRADIVSRDLSGFVRDWCVVDNDWRTVLRDVVLGGRHRRFEARDEGNSRDYSIYAYRPEPGRVALLLEDVTARNEERRKRISLDRLQGALELAGAACHELNQPLQVITGYSDLLLAETPQGHESMRQSAMEIRTAARRLAATVWRICSITRYETKSYLGRKRIIDIEKAIG